MEAGNKLAVIRYGNEDAVDDKDGLDSKLRQTLSLENTVKSHRSEGMGIDPFSQQSQPLVFTGSCRNGWGLAACEETGHMSRRHPRPHQPDINVQVFGPG